MPDRLPMIAVCGNQLAFEQHVYRCAVGKGGFSDNKREGDGCTPLGVFPLRECWYRADRMPAPQTGLPLRIIRQEDGWCDDPASAEYNKHIKIATSPSPCRGEAEWLKNDIRMSFFEPFRGGGAYPRLLAHAKQLRTNMTEAEKKLWYHLRAHRFAGYGFRRQRPMGGRYIVDFICPKKKLIIELDGGQHADSPQDKERDHFLQREGYRVLRFWNNEVMENMEGVLTVILSALESTPSLALPPRGGGNTACSYERLWRNDHVYDLIIPLGYNDDPIIPGKGSAIFLHVARAQYEPTEGCVALEKEDLLAILPSLAPATRIEIRER